MGSADEKRILKPFISEVRHRGVDIRYDSDRYWQLLADVAVKYYLNDMPVMAEAWAAAALDTHQWLEENGPSLQASGEASGDWSDLTWTPDPETIRWWTGLAAGDRIVESLEAEVKERSVGIELHSAAYWSLVAEVAVEHLHYELYNTARAWGTDMSDPGQGSAEG